MIEIDLTLWSVSVEINSGEWVLAGSGSDRHPVIDAKNAASREGGGLSLWPRLSGRICRRGRARPSDSPRVAVSGADTTGADNRGVPK